MVDVMSFSLWMHAIFCINKHHRTWHNYFWEKIVVLYRCRFFLLLRALYLKPEGVLFNYHLYYICRNAFWFIIVKHNSIRRQYAIIYYCCWCLPAILLIAFSSSSQNARHSLLLVRWVLCFNMKWYEIVSSLA